MATHTHTHKHAHMYVLLFLRRVRSISRGTRIVSRTASPAPGAHGQWRARTPLQWEGRHGRQGRQGYGYGVMKRSVIWVLV